MGQIKGKNGTIYVSSPQTQVYDAFNNNAWKNTKIFDADNKNAEASAMMTGLSPMLKNIYGDDYVQKFNDDVDSWTYGRLIDEYNKLDGDKQADVRQKISFLSSDFKNSEEGQNNDQTTMNQITALQNLASSINQYGTKKDKSIGRQLSDDLKAGGVFKGLVKDFNRFLGNITGRENISQELEDRYNFLAEDNGFIGGLNNAIGVGADVITNVATGGISGLARGGMGVYDAATNMNNKVLDYDENGNAYMRSRTAGENLGELGLAGTNLGLSLAGRSPKLGKFMPNLDKGVSAKELVKYGAKEVPFALGTTAVQEGFNNMAQGRNFIDYDPESYKAAFWNNVKGDVALDAFNYGRGKVKARVGDTDTTPILNKWASEKFGTVRDKLKQAYADGKLPIPQTKITPNAGIKPRLETAYEQGLTGDINDGIEKVGRLGSRDVAEANNIQETLNRPTLNENGELYLRGENVAEHAQKRFGENPEQNTPKYLAETTYNTLFGDGHQVIANNDNNPHSVVFMNKNNPTGIVPIGTGVDGENEIFSVVPASKRQLTSVERNALKQGLPPEGGATDSIAQTTKNVNGEVGGKLVDGYLDANKRLDNDLSNELSKRYQKISDNNYVSNNKDFSIDDLKQRQLDIINATNPDNGGPQNWIKTVDDIKTYREAVIENSEDGKPYTISPDFTAEDMDIALKTGYIRVYSSHPIEDGAWITPSRMEAENYAGNGKVYSKELRLDDVAWTDTIDGMVAMHNMDGTGPGWDIRSRNMGIQGLDKRYVVSRTGSGSDASITSFDTLGEAKDFIQNLPGKAKSDYSWGISDGRLLDGEKAKVEAENPGKRYWMVPEIGEDLATGAYLRWEDNGKFNGKEETSEIFQKLYNESVGRGQKVLKADDNTKTTPQTEVYNALTGGDNVKQNPVDTVQTMPQNTENFMAYGESKLANNTRGNMLAKTLRSVGNSLQGEQANITRAAARRLGINSTGEVVNNVREKTGITDMKLAAELSKELTGGKNSFLDDIQRVAMGASEDGKGFRIDTNEILKDVDTIVDKTGLSTAYGGEKQRRKFAEDLRRDIADGASDIITTANRFDGMAAELGGKEITGNSTEKDKAKIRALTETSQKLKDLSYATIPSENVEAMFETAVSEARARAKVAESNGNKKIAKAYNKIANDIEALPKTIPAYRSYKKDFVDLAKINKLTEQAENGAGSKVGGGNKGSLTAGVLTGVMTGNPLAGVATAAGYKLLGGPVEKAVSRLGGKISEGADRLDMRLASASNPQLQTYNALEAQIPHQMANYEYTPLSEAVKNGTLGESMDVPATGSTDVYNALSGESYSPYSGGYNSYSGGYSNGSGYSFGNTGNETLDLIARAMDLAKADNNAVAWGQLFEMYQNGVASLTEQTSSSSDVKLTDTMRRANAAERALDELEALEPDLAYNVSDIPVAGNIATMGGNSYQAAANSLALQIGFMLSGANTSETEALRIGSAYVPQPRDNAAVRQQKLARARGIINDYQQIYAE